MSDHETYSQELRISRFRCIWTLKNFSKRGQNRVYSPVFFVQADCNFKLQIIAYPNGCDNECKDYLSLYLNFISSNKSGVPIKMRLALLNAENKEINKLESETALAIGKDWGYPRFVKREYLLNESNELLKDDNLKISCKVTILPEQISGPSYIIKQVQVPKCSLPDDLGNLFESQKFCDVILSVGEQEFLAHKGILTSRSSVFAAMFEHEMEEKKQNRVTITDIDQDVLKDMLIFIYTGKADNLIKMASDLLIAADKYDLERLKAMCEKELCKKLCVENATENLIFADVHSAKQLKEQAIQFIKKHAKQIIETTEWNTKMLEYPHLLVELFKASVVE